MAEREIDEIIELLEEKARNKEITFATFGENKILVAPPFGLVMAPDSSEFREFSDNLQSLGVVADIYPAAFLLRDALKELKGELQPAVPFGLPYTVTGRRPNAPNSNGIMV